MMSTPADRRPDAQRETCLALRRAAKRAGAPRHTWPHVPRRVPALSLQPDSFFGLNVFLSAQTQWQIVSGMGGALRSGLRYEGCVPLLRSMVPSEWRDTAFEDLRTLERETLAAEADARAAQEPAPKARA